VLEENARALTGKLPAADPPESQTMLPASHARQPTRGRPAVRRMAATESLRNHLQWAIELEHFTIPPYLCALYSLDSDRNPDAAEVVRSVLVEEMLHVTLAANLLNAVGGHPQLDTPRMLQGYPRSLPHGDRSFKVPLLRFSPEAIEVFLRIERPAPVGALPESDRYETIGQFYDATRQGLRDLSTDLSAATVFCGDPARQVTSEVYSGGGGRVIPVYDLPSAIAALDEVVEQGEGASHVQVWDGDCDVFHPEREQVAHYYRFMELKLGRRYQRGDTPRSGPSGEAITIDWAGVRPMRDNPRRGDYAPESSIAAAQMAFNCSYCMILQRLEQAFRGNPQALGATIGDMYRLKPQAESLMQMRTADAISTAGPTFEYVPHELRSAP
jgi:ferritin-like protein